MHLPLSLHRLVSGSRVHVLCVCECVHVWEDTEPEEYSLRDDGSCGLSNTAVCINHEISRRGNDSAGNSFQSITIHLFLCDQSELLLGIVPRLPRLLLGCLEV